MNENTKKRREWIKNAAIVFLVIMLILTFFSNTIMNYSLPEVATQTVTSGSITAKIRGTGNVEAGEPYNVSIKETRTVSSVAVKKGDEVQKDDPLFVLEDSESTELKEAEKALEDLLLAFEQKILSGDVPSSAIDKVESGGSDSLSANQARIEKANKRLENAQNAVRSYTDQIASIDRQIALLEADKAAQNTAAEEKAKADAEKALADAQTRLSDASARVSSAQGKVDSANSAISALDLELASLGIDKKRAEEEVKKAEEAFNSAATDSVSGNDIQQLEEALKAAEAALAKIDDDISKKNLEKNSKNSDLNNAKSELGNAQNEYNNAKSNVDSCQTTLDNATAALNNKGSDITNQINALNKTKAELDTKLQTATNEQTYATEDRTELLTEISSTLELETQNEQIKKQKELIEELKGKVTDTVIKAPVAGTITAVNLVAGETTTPEQAMAVIQVADKGFTVSFSVTEAQAKNLKVGDPADLQNSWYYNDVKATLSAIKPDPENPGKNKLLVFDVSGDVQAGQSLSFSVGQKSQNYDLIVPTSAIREDNNGKFILTVESKSSPLGNRYIATRVDVEVLAQDDTQSAINAALYGYEYVITTSTKPVEAGKQVRLAD